MAQYLCKVRDCFTIPGRAFVPKPKVGSYSLPTMLACFDQTSPQPAWGGGVPCRMGCISPAPRGFDNVGGGLDVAACDALMSV